MIHIKRRGNNMVKADWTEKFKNVKEPIISFEDDVVYGKIYWKNYQKGAL